MNPRPSRIAWGISLAMTGILALCAPLAVNAADNAISEIAAKVVPYQTTPRVFVLTDIGNEPDDQMSLTRFLLYANEMNIEGLVATTSTWQREKVHTDMIDLVLGHYGEVQPNLLKHAAGFPTQSQLEKVVAPGLAGYGLAATGKGKNTAGSDLLVRAIEKSTDANHPLYINLWGGANTLAQALQDLSAKHPASTVTALTGNLVVYSISDQDDAGFWIRAHYPAITYIVDPSSQNGEDYARATWTGISAINIIATRREQISPPSPSTGWIKISAVRGRWVKVICSICSLWKAIRPPSLGSSATVLTASEIPAGEAGAGVTLSASPSMKPARSGAAAAIFTQATRMLPIP